MNILNSILKIFVDWDFFFSSMNIFSSKKYFLQRVREKLFNELFIDPVRSLNTDSIKINRPGYNTLIDRFRLRNDLPFW